MADTLRYDIDYAGFLKSPEVEGDETSNVSTVFDGPNIISKLSCVNSFRRSAGQIALVKGFGVMFEGAPTIGAFEGEDITIRVAIPIDSIQRVVYQDSDSGLRASSQGIFIELNNRDEDRKSTLQGYKFRVTGDGAESKGRTFVNLVNEELRRHNFNKQQSGPVLDSL